MAKSSSGDQWSEWAIAAQSGDKAAYRKLLREIAPFIRNYLLGGLANRDWADDITQDVLISVHRSLKTYSADRPFQPWLMAIIHFRRTDFLRKHYKARSNKQTTMDDVDFLREHVTNPTHAGEYKDIEEALQELPEQQRKIFRLFKIQGYSAQEVANVMGMKASAVKVSAHRTLNKLKEKLG